jgi:hypothetical protein
MDKQRKSDSRINYQNKVAYKVARALQLSTTLIRTEYDALKDDRPELYMEAIKGANGSEFPSGLFIEKGHTIKFATLAKGAEETYWFKRFIALAAEYELHEAGLIFPVMGMKDWVIHNYSVAMTPGKVRLLIPSSGVLNNIHITTLDTFLKEASL